MEEPRYRRIAAELRKRIEAGELAPGDRVPSTREITRRWGVAMATATKALTELRHDGLVRAVPGVGTVVDVPVTTPRTRRGDSSTPALERITASAIAIADAEGLAGVSMRRVAADTGMATMSLYRYVADKDDLVLRMMDAVFADSSFPTGAPPGWRDRLELALRTLWSIFRRHPWLAAALSLTRPQPLVNAMPFTEWVLATLEARGLDLPTALTVHLSLLNYARGTAISLAAEAEAEELSGLDNDEWIAAQRPTIQAIFATGRFPTLRRLSESRHNVDLDELFEYGLQRLLDGIATILDNASQPGNADS
jgi:DNA-binding transcriptional regulator YhcF (GntR family)